MLQRQDPVLLSPQHRFDSWAGNQHRHWGVNSRCLVPNPHKMSCIHYKTCAKLNMWIRWSSVTNRKQLKAEEGQTGMFGALNRYRYSTLTLGWFYFHCRFNSNVFILYIADLWKRFIQLPASSHLTDSNPQETQWTARECMLEKKMVLLISYCLMHWPQSGKEEKKVWHECSILSSEKWHKCFLENGLIRIISALRLATHYRQVSIVWKTWISSAVTNGY